MLDLIRAINEYPWPYPQLCVPCMLTAQFASCLLPSYQIVLNCQLPEECGLG